MTDSFYLNGFTLDENGSGLVITRDGGSPISITIPDYGTSGIDFDGGSLPFHKYVVTREIGTTSDFSAEIGWTSTKERAAPEWDNLWNVDDPVTTGSTTYVLGIGTVRHFLAD